MPKTERRQAAGKNSQNSLPLRRANDLKKDNSLAAVLFAVRFGAGSICEQ